MCAFPSPITGTPDPGTSSLGNGSGFGYFFPHFCLVECQQEEENVLLNTEHFVVDADAVGGRGAGSSVLPSFPGTARQEKVEDNLETEDRNSSVKKVEEDLGTLQATGLFSQGSIVLDGQHDFACGCGQPLDLCGDTKVGLTQEPTGQSGSQEHSESYCPAGTEKEAEKEQAKKASSGVAGAACRQEEIGPAPHQSRGAPASAAAQNSYKGSSVRESRGSCNVAKGKKSLPVKKKPRTFYSAGRSQGTHWHTVTLVVPVALGVPFPVLLCSNWYCTALHTIRCVKTCTDKGC